MKKEHRFLVHLNCCYIFLVLFLPGIVTAAQELRTALVIGNSAYSSGPLKNPVNDATDMAAMLKNLGFSVTLKEATLQQMDEAIEAFGNSLKKGGVGLFYYAGHGVQVNGTNYLLPIRAKINKETDVKYQAVDANKILDEMANANNGLNIIIRCLPGQSFCPHLQERHEGSGHRQQRSVGHIHFLFHKSRKCSPGWQSTQQPLHGGIAPVYAVPRIDHQRCIRKCACKGKEGNGSGPLGIVLFRRKILFQTTGE